MRRPELLTVLIAREEGRPMRDAAKALLTGALVYLEAIPTLARTRADTVIAACIRYYLK